MSFFVVVFSSEDGKGRELVQIKSPWQQQFGSDGESSEEEEEDVDAATKR